MAHCPRAAAETADAILGDWLDDKQTVRIRVYREHGQYHAKIVWLKDASIAPAGTQVLRNLRHDPAGKWRDGRICHPRTDAWYDCRCTLQSPSVMQVRAYIGTPVFGKTVSFTRVHLSS
jgi:uncharacterized protein (DUF2147 family)